ncbi:MAG: D-alanine--D-alanine ligase family protein [Oscillospiraceae bacterium]|jgi:D-alanine-D-alanine ligase
MNIIVLCGGLSMERDVSITSGTQVAKALRACGHNAVLVDLFSGYAGTYDNPSEVFARVQEEQSFHVSESTDELEAFRAAAIAENKPVIGEHVIELCRAADITFLALHGEDGENGKVQAALDLAGVKYTGGGYLGSALAMNKELTKILLQHAGIATPMGIIVHKDDTSYANVGFPCVVKPCSGGSSVGTSIVQNEEEYLPALELAFRFEDSIVVETFVKGRELTVGVLGNTAMPAIEIIPKTGFYDYKNKYQAGMTEELCPAPLTEEETKAVQNLAVRVKEVLMVDVYCRVDFLLDDAGRFYCLEANTLPGMTPTSLLPQMAAEMGMHFGELCEKIMELSLRKYEA